MPIYRKKNKFAQDPQRRPPPGWRVENMTYQRMLADAQRTGCQSLIEQVEALRDAERSDQYKVSTIVSDALKGRIEPATVDLQGVIDSYKEKE